MYNKETLDPSASDYAANIERWRLYADPTGGAAYRNGEYLFKYTLETGGE